MSFFPAIEEIERENTSLRQCLDAFTRVLSPEPKVKKSKKSTVEREIIDLGAVA